MTQFEPSPHHPFDACVDQLPGIGPKRAALLLNLGIRTIRDLLFHFPRDYQDRRHVTPIGQVHEGPTVTIEGEVVSTRTLRLRRRLSLAEVTLRDDTGIIKAIWFGRDFLARAFTPGARGIFTGPVGKFRGLALKNPDYEMLSGDEEDRLNTGRVVPIYRLTEGITQRMVRRWVRAALKNGDSNHFLGRSLKNGYCPHFHFYEETLPGELREKHGFPGVHEALGAAHFPDEIDTARTARNRFAYEELLGIQLGILSVRAERLDEEKGIRHVMDGPRLETLRRSLPFELTPGQQRAVADILKDMASPRPMVRLLQGDVGCGKTVVALHAVAAAADGGHQTALMAPTEILAEQHGLSLRDMLTPLGLSVELLTGATSDARTVRQRIASGACQVVVGTHALIQENVAFERLGLAIIDEQHRFGVLQRSALVEKGFHADLLHMTATPIPRTLAITVYGGMDISVIDELPPGRLPINTRRVTPAKVPGLYRYVLDQAAQGRQTYYVCPLVEESDKRELASVTTHFEQLSAGPFAGLRTGLVHGRLPAAEKEAAMRRLKAGEIDVLFSTSVIEVGIDCPTATTMIIEDAGQFGLTQLHQLRGRVGRGAEQSYCFLLGKPKTDDGKRRLKIMCATTSGFEIAEADLAMRGPGEFQGIRQAGLSDLHVADLIRDARLLDAARRDARDILERDPALAARSYAHLAAAAQRFRELNA